jgi:hypothetical protein
MFWNLVLTGQVLSGSENKDQNIKGTVQRKLSIDSLLFANQLLGTFLKFKELWPFKFKETFLCSLINF